MSKKWLASIGAALALVLAAGTFDTAEARKGGGFHFGGGGKFYGARPFAGPRFYAGPRLGYHHPHKHRHHFRRGIIIGAPLVYGAYYYGYGSCRWLRIRALETGSSYWWSRYEDCIRGY